MSRVPYEQDSRPYSVHITPSRRKVRRYVCRRATEEQAAYAADKLLKGAPGALVVAVWQGLSWCLHGSRQPRMTYIFVV